MEEADIEEIGLTFPLLERLPVDNKTALDGVTAAFVEEMAELDKDLVIDGVMRPPEISMGPPEGVTHGTALTAAMRSSREVTPSLFSKQNWNYPLNWDWL